MYFCYTFMSLTSVKAILCTKYSYYLMFSPMKMFSFSLKFSHTFSLHRIDKATEGKMSQEPNSGTLFHWLNAFPRFGFKIIQAKYAPAYLHSN